VTAVASGRRRHHGTGDEHHHAIAAVHPLRGGIPRHTTLLAEAAAARNIDLQVITFTRRNPSVLYKGASDRDLA
jgi:hypothetical protein